MRESQRRWNSVICNVGGAGVDSASLSKLTRRTRNSREKTSGHQWLGEVRKRARDTDWIMGTNIKLAGEMSSPSTGQ